MNKLLLLLSGVAVLTGCKAFKVVTDTNATSLGAPYELIVVVDQPIWEGELGDTLRHVLEAPIPYLASAEPHFKAMRTPVSSYKGMVAAHRNILLVNVDPSIAEPGSGVKYNVAAAPQIVLTLQGSSQHALAEYVSQNRHALIEIFESAERDRSISYARKFNEAGHTELVRKLFGVEMPVPKGYMLAQQSEDFLWFRHEFPIASQGFMLYSYPYEGAASMTEQALLEARDTFSARIPGPSDGSHMTTSKVFMPTCRMFRLEGRLWIEMRGFWDVEGDWMGGPFVSYTTIDEATNRVFTLDCYVYSPKNPKRNHLRAVEHLLYLIEFPGNPAESAEN